MRDISNHGCEEDFKQTFFLMCPLLFHLQQARSGRIYDAVLTVARAIEEILSENKSLSQPPVGNGLCRSDKPWIDGEMLLDKMKGVRFLLQIE